MRVLQGIWRCGILLLYFLPSAASGQEPSRKESAWDLLRQTDVRAAEAADPLERELLGLLTPSQARDFRRGAPPASIWLASGESFETFLARKGFPQLDLSWYSVDGGGAAMSGGDFRLTAVTGQAEGGELAGGAFRLREGFFAAVPPPLAMPCTGAGLIFCDGFESGNLEAWSQAFSGAATSLGQTIDSEELNDELE